MSHDHTVVVGLGYGDEGKGSVVDYLAERKKSRFVAPAVVRFGGGPQAAHHVVRPDGEMHCFSQVGSGAFSGAGTFLSRGMAISIENLLTEVQTFKWPVIMNMMIEPGCVLITPLHKMICQMKEIARGNKRHGTVGMGVAEAVRERRLRLSHAEDHDKLLNTLKCVADERFYEASRIHESLPDKRHGTRPKPLQKDHRLG